MHLLRQRALLFMSIMSEETLAEFSILYLLSLVVTNEAAADWLILVSWLVLYSAATALTSRAVKLVIYDDGACASTVTLTRAVLPQVAASCQAPLLRLLPPVLTENAASIVTDKHKTVLKRIFDKTMPNMIEAINNGGSLEEKMLIATTSHATFVTALSNRCERHELARLLDPMTAAVQVLGRVIRMHKRHVVTVAMQQQVISRFVVEAESFRGVVKATIEAGTWPDAVSKALVRVSSGVTASTVSPDSSSSSSSSSGHTKKSNAFSNRQRKFMPRNAAVASGVMFVPRRPATANVNPRGSALRGSGAVCR